MFDSADALEQRLIDGLLSHVYTVAKNGVYYLGEPMKGDARPTLRFYSFELGKSRILFGLEGAVNDLSPDQRSILSHRNISNSDLVLLQAKP